MFELILESIFCRQHHYIIMLSCHLIQVFLFIVIFTAMGKKGRLSALAAADCRDPRPLFRPELREIC